MQLSLLNLKFHNIRDFSDLEIPLSKSKNKQPHHITLLQMPNGTGKTTSLILMSAAICGREFNEDEVRSFRPTQFEAAEGFFEALMLIDDEQVTVKIDFDYSNNTCMYSTSKPGRSGGGLSPGHNIPYRARMLLTQKFTHLFVFDGELSVRLLNKKETEAEAAISSLHFLDRMGEITLKIDELIEEERAKAESKAYTDKGLKILRGNASSVRDILKGLEDDLKRTNEHKEEAEKAFKTKKAEYEGIVARSKEDRSSYNDLKDKITKKKQQIIDNARTLMVALRRPALFSRQFHDELSSLANQMTKLKLPKTISYEFFQELAQSSQCICGEKIDDKKRATIIANAEKYLSEDKIQVMNSLKYSVRSMGDFRPLDDVAEKIVSLHSDLNVFEQELTLMELRVDKDSRERAEKLQTEMGDLKHQIDEDGQFIKFMTEEDTTFQKDHTLTFKDNIPLCKRQISDLQKRIAEAADTLEFELKAKTLKMVIDSTISLALDEIKTKVVLKSNKRIEELLGNDEVRIHKIDQCIMIDKKEGVSQGQSLAVAYAFLATLFEDSSHKVPFVVDSPAGSLDLEVRREVSNLIPQLFPQLVVFILSSERDGFVDGLAQQYDDIQYYTIFKDPGARGKTVLDDNVDFFMNFHSETEAS
jgi:hypothetical protein